MSLCDFDHFVCGDVIKANQGAFNLHIQREWIIKLRAIKLSKIIIGIPQAEQAKKQLNTKNNLILVYFLNKDLLFNNKTMIYDIIYPKREENL